MLLPSDMDRDLVVLVASSSPHLPSLVLERMEEGATTSTVALLSLVPDFKLQDQRVEVEILGK